MDSNIQRLQKTIDFPIETERVTKIGHQYIWEGNWYRLTYKTSQQCSFSGLKNSLAGSHNRQVEGSSPSSQFEGQTETENPFGELAASWAF